MARKNSGLCLARQRKIPKSVEAKIDQIHRLLSEIPPGYRHLVANPGHFRDGPARQRFLANRRRIALLFHLLEDQMAQRANSPLPTSKKKLAYLKPDEARQVLRERVAKLRGNVENRLQQNIEEIDRENSNQEG